jgi:hypothetical protein
MIRCISPTVPTAKSRKAKPMDEQTEKYVDLEAVAEFLGETRRYVLYLARTGVIRSYALSGRTRIIRKFKISEVARDLLGRHRKIRRKRNEGTDADEKEKSR